VGAEFGTTTGRARRVGWFDAAVARYAVDTNGIDSIVLTKVDVLDEVPTLRICTGYLWRGEFWDHPMANISHLKHCEPVYEEMPGWMAPTRECRAYIERLAELAGAEVDVVSVGPDREHTLVRRPLV
jgi:adenylosuccinate synthase